MSSYSGSKKLTQRKYVSRIQALQSRNSNEGHVLEEKYSLSLVWSHVSPALCIWLATLCPKVRSSWNSTLITFFNFKFHFVNKSCRKIYVPVLLISHGSNELISVGMFSLLLYVLLCRSLNEIEYIWKKPVWRDVSLQVFKILFICLFVY